MARHIRKLESDQTKYDQLLKRLIANGVYRAPVNLVRSSARIVPKTSRQRTYFVLLVGLVITLAVGSGTYLWYFQDDTWNIASSSNSHNGFRAAIIDELSVSYQDVRFIHNVTNNLNKIGYTVDYYGPAKVTVSLFQTLATKQYELIILRAHSGNSLIYTSDHYSDTNYLPEQLTGQLERVLLDGQFYFAITADFIKHSMTGKFPDSLVVEMGCSGLTSPGLAQAFVSKGARAFVGWDGSISAGRTDDSITVLIQGLVHGNSVKDAVAQAQTVSTRLDRLSLEPPYGLHLRYYDTSMLPKQELSSRLLNSIVVLSIILMPVLPIIGIVVFLKLSGRR